MSGLSQSGMVVYDRPSSSPSIVRKWADVLSFGHATPLLRQAESHIGMSHVAAALESVRMTGEGLVTGGMLGALSGAGMLDVDGIPLDGAGGVLASFLGVLAARHEIGTTLRHVGANSMAVFGFRKTEEWLGVRKATMHGEEWGGSPVINTTGADMGDEDPIIAAAKKL